MKEGGDDLGQGMGGKSEGGGRQDVSMATD